MKNSKLYDFYMIHGKENMSDEAYAMLSTMYHMKKKRAKSIAKKKAEEKKATPKPKKKRVAKKKDS